MDIYFIGFNETDEDLKFKQLLEMELGSVLEIESKWKQVLEWIHSIQSVNRVSFTPIISNGLGGDVLFIWKN